MKKTYVPVREVDANNSGREVSREYPWLQPILSTNVEEVGSIQFETNELAAEKYGTANWMLPREAMDQMQSNAEIGIPESLRPHPKKNPKEIESRKTLHMLLEILTNSGTTPSNRKPGYHTKTCQKYPQPYCIERVEITETGLRIRFRFSCLPVHFWKDARNGNYRVILALFKDNQVWFRCTSKDLIKALSRRDDETKPNEEENETVPGPSTGTKRPREEDNPSPSPRKKVSQHRQLHRAPAQHTQIDSAPAISTYVNPIALTSAPGQPERIEQEKDPPRNDAWLTSLVDSLGSPLPLPNDNIQLESRDCQDGDPNLFNVKHKPPDTNQSTAEASLAFPSFSLLGRIEQEKDPPDDQFLDEVSLTSLVDSLGSPLCLPNDNIQLESRDCQDGDPNLFNVKHKPPDTNSGLAEEVPDFQFPANTSAQSDFILPDELDDLFIPEDWLLNLSHPNIIDQ